MHRKIGRVNEAFDQCDQVGKNHQTVEPEKYQNV
jgi:hypothetical protein